MKIEIDEAEKLEIFEREVKKFGTSGHVIVPNKIIGEKVKVISNGLKSQEQEKTEKI